MLWMYMAMLETAEQKDKIAYIYENYAGMMYHVAIGVVGNTIWRRTPYMKPFCV